LCYQEAEDIFSTIEDDLKSLGHQSEMPQEYLAALSEIKDVFNATVSRYWIASAL
jgi:hypothetical protein